MKTKEELLEQLEKIEDNLFLIDMIDHWEESTRKRYDELIKEEKTLKKELEIIENE